MKLLKTRVLALCLVATSTALGMEKKPPFSPQQTRMTFREYNNQLAADMIKAVVSQDTTLMKKLLSEGIDINHTYIFTNTRNQQVISVSTTALTSATGINNNMMVDFLLKKGADPNLKNDRGQTSLHMAAGLGYKDIAEELLKNGARINTQDNNGFTSLALAAAYGHKDLVALLLHWRADQTLHGTRNQRRFVPLDLATINANDSSRISNRSNYIEIVTLLTRYASKDFLKAYYSLANDIQSNRTIALLDQPLQDFMIWFKNGAKTADIVKDEKKLFTFTGVAFTMPGCNEEFQNLLALVKKNDYIKIFTPEVIQQALKTSKVPAFEVLLPLIAQDRDLVNNIRAELVKLDDPSLVNAIQEIIKKEVGKFSMNFPSRDVNFSFIGTDTEKKRKHEESVEPRKETKQEKNPEKREETDMEKIDE